MLLLANDNRLWLRSRSIFLFNIIMHGRGWLPPSKVITFPQMVDVLLRHFATVTFSLQKVWMPLTSSSFVFGFTLCLRNSLSSCHRNSFSSCHRFLMEFMSGDSAAVFHQWMLLTFLQSPVLHEVSLSCMNRTSYP